MPRTALGATLLALCGMAAPSAAAAGAGAAIITRDQAALRAAPRDSAQQQAVLWQGEIVEVRGERLDYLQVYDYRRERGGFVRASHARRLDAGAGAAPELLAILRFLREAPGAEALGIGVVAMAYVEAAPAEALRGAAGIEALDALGTFADRLAQRASSAPTQYEGRCGRRCPRTSTSPSATACASRLSSATGACRCATTATRSVACSRCARRRRSVRAPRSR